MNAKTQTTETKSRATRTTEQALAQQKADAERDRAQAQPPTANSTTTVTLANGFDEPASGAQIMQGSRCKFVDGRYSEQDGAPMPSPLIAVGTTTCVVMWKDRKPTTIPKEAGKDLPDPDELNAKIPIEQWEKGLDGKPTPPWKMNWVIYLLDPKTAGIFTLINSTRGQKIAVENLELKVRTMRALRGHSVVPIVELASKPMLTEFGKKLRPDFTVIGWRDLGGVSAPQIEHEPDQIGEPVAPVSLSEELNDEIPEFGASQK